MSELILPQWFREWLESQPPQRTGLGTTFKRITTTLIIPTGADPNVGPVIVLDGTTGIITIIGAGGGIIELDPTGTTPVIRFPSDNGNVAAFINQPATNPAHASLGLNSGQFLPADGIARTIRAWLNSQSGTGLYEIINANTQAKEGGYCDIRYDSGEFGYEHVGNAVNHWIKATANRVTLYDDVHLGGVVGQYRRDTATTITNNTAIPWTVEDFDDMGLHSTITNPTRITATRAGRYRLGGVARHQAITSGSALSTGISINGTGQAGGSASISANSSPSAGSGIQIVPFTATLAVNDYFEITVGNNQATAVNCNGSMVSIEYLGP